MKRRENAGMVIYSDTQLNTYVWTCDLVITLLYICPGLLIPVTKFSALVNAFFFSFYLVQNINKVPLFWMLHHSSLYSVSSQAFLSWGFFEGDVHGRNNPKAGKRAPGERWTEWNKVFTLLLWTQPSQEIEAPPWAAVVSHKEYSLPYEDLIFEVQIAYLSLSINLYREPKGGWHDNADTLGNLSAEQTK